jgi:membrane protein
MAFYHFLAIFPSLLVFLAIGARIPRLGDALQSELRDLTTQMLPGPVSQLLQRMAVELSHHAHSKLHLLSVVAGASWASFNGTWAMIYGLNTAYEVEERRGWRTLTLTILGLTLSLAVTASIAAVLIFCGRSLEPHLPGGAFALHAVEWLVLAAAVLFSFAVLYRFAPNLRDHEWRSSTPGALCALVLWIGSTFAARLYFDHINDYACSYGHLNGVVMLLLWLYVTNGAILIGGEMNSEIEKAAGAADDPLAGNSTKKDPSRAS